MNYSYPVSVRTAFVHYQTEIILILMESLNLSRQQADSITENGICIADNCFWQSLSPSTAAIFIIRDLENSDFPYQNMF